METYLLPGLFIIVALIFLFIGYFMGRATAGNPIKLPEINLPKKEDDPYHDKGSVNIDDEIFEPYQLGGRIPTVEE